jgi:ubiquinone biosynthesis accessory factor UbiJ
MLKNLLLPILQTALNYFVQLDPGSAVSLSELIGKSIKIDIKNLSTDWILTIQQDAIQQVKIILQKDKKQTVDTVIEGTTYGFLYLACHIGDSTAIIDTNIKIAGDIRLGQKIQALLQNFSIDWEEHLSHVIGDIAAHALSWRVKRIWQWQQSTFSHLLKTSSEYLQEEAQLLPTRSELEDFFADIALLRIDIDRVQARLIRLQQTTIK